MITSAPLLVACRGLLALALLATLPALAQPKRGAAYGYHLAADLRALASGVAWWYN